MEKHKEKTQLESDISSIRGELSNVKQKVEEKMNNPKVEEISEFLK